MRHWNTAEQHGTGFAEVIDLTMETAEQNGTHRRNTPESSRTRAETGRAGVFSGQAKARNSGEFPTTHHPPLKGGGGGGGRGHSALPGDERRVWLRENLPTIASVVDEFADAFGRDQVRVTYAAEGWHVIGCNPVKLEKPKGTANA